MRDVFNISSIDKKHLLGLLKEVKKDVGLSVDSKKLLSKLNLLENAIEEVSSAGTDSNEKDYLLQSKIEQLSEAQNLAHIGSWEWDVINNQIFWSDELFRIYGYEPNEVNIGFGSADGFIHYEDKERVKNTTEPAYKNKTPFTITYRIIDKKNELKIVEEKCKVVSSNGRVTKLFGTVYDITSHINVIEALKTSEEKFQKIFSLSPAGIAITDIIDGTFVDANESFLGIVGYNKEELIGKNTKDINLVNWNEREKIVNEIKKSGTVKNIEINFRKKSGEKGTMLYSTELIEIEKRACLLILVYEISERKKIEANLVSLTEELKRSNAELEQFAYIASHDLQEPLRTITSYLQLIETRYKDKLDDDGQDFINFAVDGSTRMRSLIASLLEYSRVNRELNFVEIDMKEKVTEVVNELGIRIQECGAEIIINELPVIVADQILIGQLIRNLLTNALKYKSAYLPIIEISSYQDSEFYIFSIEDNGIGIPNEYLQKIFIIFQQLHTKGKYPGTGIGLAVCKKIVEKHKGKIWVESVPGVGSTFYFSIKMNLDKGT